MAAASRKKTNEVVKNVGLLCLFVLYYCDLGQCVDSENCIPGVETQLLKKLAYFNWFVDLIFPKITNSSLKSAAHLFLNCLPVKFIYIV